MIGCWMVDTGVSMDGNMFAESNGLDEVLLDLANQLNDADTG